MKYIFVTGAPGSKWSSVVKNIYYSPDVNQSDYSEARTYYHDASGQMELMHLGAYFDPGMEFGKFFHRLNEFDYYQCEAEFDAPFSGQGVRVIKSHVFADHIDYIRETWPDCPIVLVHRDDDACLGWWVKCGHFEISYPDYAEYYQNLRTMAGIIQRQNKGIVTAQRRYSGSNPLNNHDLARLLGIAQSPAEYAQDYGQSNVTVTVI
jgi:hypothetical protein